MELVERVVGPDVAKHIEVDVVPKLRLDDSDWFEIQDGSTPGKIFLRGTNGVSVASALNWYLRYYCKKALLLLPRTLRAFSLAYIIVDENQCPTLIQSS